MSNGGSYEPRAIEPDIYAFWEQGGYFHAEPDPGRKPYVIDIPLPNVTGSLHLGHALNNTIQDVLIRRARMLGFNAMWMPGTDHAGIATQAVVEKRLREDENLTRHELGREGLVERIWAWKEKFGGQILRQLRGIGCSCDWERTRFTLDDVCARAVYEVFFQWFKAGLIYRGLRLVNWDAQLQTAVADDEIIYETVPSNLWHYRYPIEGSVGVSPAEGVVEGKDYLVIATTRPETMLGDTAVAVHPDDERYKHLIGKKCILPLVNRPIPIIADGILVKPEFGTGCVKVTPGHDPNDYAFGQRHDVEIIDILTLDGRINENGGKYAGMSVEEARAAVVGDLEALGLMEKIEPYQHEVGHSDRSKTPIEPMRSEQWFVKMGDLCETAMEAVRDGRVKFFPQRYAKTYLDWLGEKRDWCISRQLWWGHRIPVWTAVIAAHHYGAMQGSRNARTETQAKLSARLQMALDEFGRVIGCPSDFSVRPAEESSSAHLYVCARTPRAQKELVVVAESMTRHVRDAGPNVPAMIWHGDLRWPAYEKIHGIVGSLEQDPDVLDTWFSSAIWPFSTLGWPDDYGRYGGTEARRHGGEGEAPAEPGSAGASPSLDAGSAGASPSLSDLDYFYPTSVLVTAREIITLWVARMVMTGLYFQNHVPFDHVHIHPNIQDGTGRRMSKSAGNGVDPLNLIELYGADAMRFTLVQMSTETQDVRMPVSYLCPHCQALIAQDSVVPKNKVPAEVQKVTCKQCKKPFATVWAGDEMKRELGVARDTSDRFELGRNFCNKLWQAATGFVIPNVAAASCGGRDDRPEAGPPDDSWPRPLKPGDLAIEDHWILSRLSACIEEVDRRFERYQLNEAANALYGFFWGEFCDWYVELVKPRLFSRDAAGAMVRHDDDSSHVARQVLVWVLDQTLRLLHPIVPFVTEELWHKLNEAAPQRGIQEIRSVGPFDSAQGRPPSSTSRSVGSPCPTSGGQTINPALIAAKWPDASAWHRESDVEREMQALQDVIRGLREIRTHVNKIRSAAKQGSIRSLPRAVVKAEARLAESLRQREPMLRRLGQCDTLEIGPDVAKPPESASKVLSGIEVYVPLSGLANLDVERERLRKERDELAGHARRLEQKLANQGFVSKAPAAVVERERTRLAELRDKLAAVERNLAEVGG